MKNKLFNLSILLSGIMLCCGLISFGQAPSFEWAINTGDASNDYARGIAADAAGNVYVTGYFQGSADFDPGTGTAMLTSNGGQDIFLAKYDAGGNYVWAISMGTSVSAFNEAGNGIALDAAGNIYITGVFGDVADFDPGTGTAALTAGATDAFVAKYDTNGNYLWAINVGGNEAEAGQGVAVDPAGNVYITGNFWGTAEFNPGSGTATLTPVAGSSDAFVAKYDPSGNYVWAGSIGGSGADEGQAIAVDTAGNVYVTGYFSNANADFDPGTAVVNLTYAAGNDAFIAKYNTNGDYLWAKSIGSGSTDRGTGVALDAAGNVYLTGYFQGSADFNPGTGDTLKSGGGNDIFVARYDANGNYQWSKGIGGTGSDLGQAIAVDIAASIYITGGLSSAADFDPGPDTATLTPTGNSDVFVAKYDSGGNYLWAGKMGGGAPDIGYAIATGSTNVYVAGMFGLLLGGTGDFDPGPDTVTLTSAGAADMFVVKLCGPLPFSIDISGPDSICKGGTYTYTASPGAASYTWQLPGGWTGSSTTNTIEVTTGNTEGIITVIANGGCDTSAPQSLHVRLLLQPVLITVDEFTLGTSSSDYDTWQWFLNDTTLPGQTNPTLNANKNGKYSVVVTKDGCSDTAHYTVNNVSVNEVHGAGREINIYPNPAEDFMHVHTTGHGQVRLAIRSLEGKLLEAPVSGNKIMTGNLSSGLYLLYITDESGHLLSVRRFVKK